MMDTRSNELVGPAPMSELKKKIPPAHRGPTYRVGEVVNLKGYGFKIHAIEDGEILLVPHGPLPLGGKAPGRRLAKGKKPAK